MGCYNPSKIGTVIQWKQPTNTNEASSFLGLAGYYQRFVEGFSMIRSLLTTLTHKYVKWMDACEKSFQELEEWMVMTPILTIPKEKKGFYDVL